ncbi:hypothetical protein [Rhodococcus qingshengii]|uniref:hypothetical protein n=1 Tax=Rhodococcus qingshengii TaxID=334542 RepID=UPI00237CDF2D|nr:hypothetical protein [Rhodococcus qingshengii]WCT05757.1 hypothetical protein PI247_30215 [Rhodococcus qingshengii]
MAAIGGADAIFDTGASYYLERNLRALNPFERIMIGMQSGKIGDLDLYLDRGSSAGNFVPWNAHTSQSNLHRRPPRTGGSEVE